MRKIDEVQNEIFQLKTTFNFTNTRNAKENSIVLEGKTYIHKESLDVWKEKIKPLRNKSKNNNKY
jgi:hypothetical protein